MEDGFSRSHKLAHPHNLTKYTAKERLLVATNIVDSWADEIWASAGERRKAIKAEYERIENEEKNARENIHVLSQSMKKSLFDWFYEEAGIDLTTEDKERLLATARKYKAVNFVTEPTEVGMRRNWLRPEAKLRVTGTEMKRANQTRTSSLFSYSYRRRNNLRGVALGEAEFFLMVVHNGTSYELAHTRALRTSAILTGTSDKLFKLQNPNGFDGRNGRLGPRGFINCAQIIGLAGLIRDRGSLFVIDRTSALNLEFTT